LLISAAPIQRLEDQWDKNSHNGASSSLFAADYACLFAILPLFSTIIHFSRKNL